MKFALTLFALACASAFAAAPATPKWVKLMRKDNAVTLEWSTSYETNIQAFRLLRTIPGAGLTGSQPFTLGVPLLSASGVRYVAAEQLYHWRWTDTNAISTNTYTYSISADTITGSSAWVSLPMTITINAPK